MDAVIDGWRRELPERDRPERDRPEFDLIKRAARPEVAEEVMRAWAAVQERLFVSLSPQLARQGSETLRAVLLALGDREPEAPASRTAG
jgi:hypothetical protein